MTVSQLIETLAGKVAALEGNEIDGTSNIDFDIDDIRKRLASFGYEPNGFEYCYNGMTGRKMKRPIFIGPTYYQRLKHMVMDKIHCLTLDHEVLTKQGFKSYTELTYDDEIACLDNNKLVYTKPIKLLYYPNYKGNMYKIKNKHIDLYTTDNHRMWVQQENSDKYELIEAKDIINKPVKYQTNTEYEQRRYKFKLPGVPKYDIKEKLVTDMNAFIVILGHWVVNKTMIHNKNIIEIKQHPYTTVTLLKAIYRLDYDHYIHNDVVQIFNLQLYNYLIKYGKYQLPDWVFELNMEQSKLLLTTIMHNGHEVISDTKMFYTTKSQGFANNLIRLALHAGWSGKIVKPKQYLYRVVVNKQSYELCKEQIERTEYFEGPVFCLQVPSEVFYVRRKGKGVFTGNSRARGRQTLLTRQANRLPELM